MDISIPVMIIGAGPTGLTMACELARYGVNVKIIDKKPVPIQTSNALGVHVRTLELWYDMGIVDEALTRGQKIAGVTMHAGKQKLVHAEFHHLATAFPFLLSLPQSETEKLLNQHLTQYGITVERPAELLDISQNTEYVTVTYQDNQNQQQQVQCRYLIACDGSHSTIRDKLKLDFIGEDFYQHFIMTDTAIDTSLNMETLHLFFAEQGVVAIFPMRDKRARVICDVSNDPKLKDTKEPQIHDFQTILDQRCQTQIRLYDPAWMTGFWIHNRQIKQYWHNRVFFAGDAAHVHSPAGGQGMNTSIQDAYNLAWKLAYVLQNKAKTQLLDSYQLERHPIAKQVLIRTKAATKMLTTRNRFTQWLRNTVLKWILSKPQNRERMILEISELAIKYPNSPLNHDDSNNKKGPKPGERVPYVQGLFEKLTGTQFHLLLLTHNTASDNIHHITDYIREHHNNIIQVHVIEKKQYNGIAHNVFAVNKECLYLVRPDNYICYRAMPADLAKLTSYLTRILSQPATVETK